MDKLSRYQEWLSSEEISQLAATLELPLLPALRINNLKISPDQARSTWPEWYGWEVENVPFCESGWQIMRHSTPIGQTLEYRSGAYYIQDAASMLPAELFTSADSLLILDMAAAPGGKTTHLVSRFHDHALIVANDSSLERIAALRSNLQTWGAIGVLVTHYPGERWGQWFPETFDKVLLDAPCSGDTLRREKGRKKRPVSSKEQQALCQRQLALLNSAFQALKPGGEIVYATCTLAPEENEGVLDALLKLYANKARIEAIGSLPGSGIVLAGYHPDVSKGVRLWPHHYHTSGFFAARIRKMASVAVHINAPPIRHTAELEKLGKTRYRELVRDMLESYGVDLMAILEQHGASLWQRGTMLYAVPDGLFMHFGDLPHIRAGLMVGQISDSDFVPSHELITRFNSQFSRPWMTIAEEHVAIWLTGRDLRGVSAAYPVGTIVLLRDERGRFLGRGKLLRDRLRNLLPKRAV